MFNGITLRGENSRHVDISIAAVECSVRAGLRRARHTTPEECGLAKWIGASILDAGL